MIPDRLSLARRLRRVFWPVSVEREIADELSAHLELQTRRFIAAGMSEADARAAARMRFGDVDRVRDECRDIRTQMETDMRRAELVEDLRLDARFAIRTLRRAPLFTTVAVITIALGVGANTAIFSVLEAVLLRPLPYRFADRVEMIWNGNTESAARTAVAVPEYLDLKAQLRAHDAVAAIYPQPSPLVGDGGEPERVNAYVVTPNLFDLLGAAPMIGRGFVNDDGTMGAPRVIILSHELWTRRFGADRSAIGRIVTVAGLPRTIIGVMPAGVRFPDAPLDFLREHADLWIPSTLEGSRGGSRGNQFIAVVARRAAGSTEARGAADVDGVAEQWRHAYADRYAIQAAKHWKLVALPMREQMVGGARAGLFVITAAVSLVLLIACVNVANLLLARGAARQREIAIRVALGAGRVRLVRQLVTEAVLLAAAGGALGLGLAWLGMRLLLRLDAGALPRMGEAGIDASVLVFTGAVSIITGLLVGAVPAIQQSSRDLRHALDEGTRGGGGPAKRRLRSTLVAAQVGMALIVLIASALLGRSFLALERVNPGFSSSAVLTLQFNLPHAKYDSAYKTIAFYDELTRQARALPGVVEVSGGYPVPMSGDGWSGSIRVDGEPDGPNDPMPHAEYGVALPGFFHALRVPLVTGRDFAATDTPDAPQVVIVDVILAREHWPNESAIGKRVNGATVIGVVGHVHKAGPQSEGEPQIYLPYAQSAQNTLSMVMRARGEPLSLAAPVRVLVHRIDPQMPISRLRTLDDLVAQATARQRLDAVLLGVFALTALALASVGLYGVMGYLVSQRSREIGIRIALGGHPAAIRTMVLREGLWISGAGLVGGLVVSLLASRALGGLLFGVSPTDPITYVAISATLVLVSVAASYGPARRATRVDPLIAMRD
jgi:predicted permease